MLVLCVFDLASSTPGDVTVFYQDVPHCGPAHPPVVDDQHMSKWRWVLFAMFSPSEGAEQDAAQQYLQCE
jgi:hypothetical protein